MLFVSALISFIFFAFALANQPAINFDVQAVEKRDASAQAVDFLLFDDLQLQRRDYGGISTETYDEIDQYLKQLVAAVGAPNVANSSDLSKRDSNPALTAAFTALNKSGVGVEIVHGLVTNSLSQPQAITAIEQYIKQNTLPTLLSAADNSGLAVSIVMRFFINYSLVPGLWNIIVALYKNGTIFKRGLLDLIGSVIGGVQQSIWASLINLLSLVANVETVCESLNNSGFGVSVVDDIVSTSDGQAFAVKAATAIINDSIITLDSLFSALNLTSFLQNTFTKIISNSTYRKIIFIWAVNFLVSAIKYIF
ncbi:conserved hypothetical protein [Lodderomyces elongisporus NRRL YB-4239]|uniref:Uncharacterized protein n=1 Tax=Lodderomyces elongisporus (strain ATCC 11503 / CBS 2605 / JCM 1781 / NBRC 1676 / NRRL YB-4239) TaxID=379508 RepID=A5DYE5_LODEL|nr:conserved hypothetical protein [Lodderomyces elongisporus NRRL YB-4239]